MTNPAEAAAQTGEALRQRKVDEYIANKRKRLQNPDCIVIAARVLDSHLLAQMLVALDRSMNIMRIRAGGPSISVKDAATAGQSITAWIQKAKDLSTELSPRSVFAVAIDVDSVKENDILARQRNTYAFVPSTPEGASLARMIKVFDAAFLEYRTKAPMQDSASVNAAFSAVRNLVKEFHDITEGMTKKTNTRFIPPKSYPSYVSRGVN
jgi:hypothetical protein